VATRAVGAVLVVVVGLVPLLLGGPAFAVLMAALGLACWREYLLIARHLTPAPGVSRYGATTVALLAAAGLFGWPLPLVVVVAFAGVLAPLVRQFRRSGEPDVLTYWGLGAAGSLYVGLPVLAATSLRGLDGQAAPWLERFAAGVSLGWPPAAHGLAWAVAAVVCTWLADTGAFLVGRSLGRRRLSRQISPNKTVEGAVGGLLGAVIAGAVCWAAFGLAGGWPLGAAVGLVLGIVGQVGDLAESFVKRQAGVKDSGNVIPGHGGVFDRVDALFVAFPVAWALASILDAVAR
jgi:phosphatidate cytidylyltransferase